MPDNSYNRSSQFLRVFGRPEAASVCECERVQSSSLAQSLHLLNSQEMKGKLANSSGRAERLAKEDKLPEAKIRELYLAAFSREPRSDELQTALDYLNESIVGADGKPVDARQGQPRKVSGPHLGPDQFQGILV